MISVVDLAFELWFASCGLSPSLKESHRKNVFEPCVSDNSLTDLMESAFKTAVIVLRLAQGGAFVKSPVGSPSVASAVH